MTLATSLAVRAVVAACIALCGTAVAVAIDAATPTRPSIAPAAIDPVAIATAEVARAGTGRGPAVAPGLERNRFLPQPTIPAVALSPDGRSVAWLREIGRDREVWWRSTRTGGARRLLQRTTARDLVWTRDARWLLLETPRELFALSTDGRSGSGIATTLGGADAREFLGADPVRLAAAIVRERVRGATPDAPTQWRLLRIDVRGRRELLHADPHRIVGHAFDHRGRLAYVQRVEGLALVVYRIDGDGHSRVVLRCTALRSCTPLTTTPDDDALILRGHVDDASGRELLGLLRLRSDGRLVSMHLDPAGESDLEGLAFDPATRQPAIAFHASTGPAMFAVDAAMRPHVQRLREAFVERSLRIDIGHGADARWLIEERASQRPGRRWHLYDPVAGTIAPLFDDAPRNARTRAMFEPVPEAALARRTPVRWRAGDGMALHGFVSLPPGRDPRTLPLVTLVHGGPWNHARPDYNASVQLLVNRGYAVFEPNFRGSTGYGRACLLAPRGDFGNGRVQADIVEGTRAMLAAGIGDPRRVGIVGASFGGYSTLLGLTHQPELFKVGVAFVPPPDFAWVLQWIRRNPEALELGATVPMDDWLRMLDLDPDDAHRMATLRAQSPLANVARMDRPLLIVAGGEDRRVGIAGVIEYAARLKLAGKDVSLLIDPDADHGARDALAREANLYLLEAMLHRHLGGDAPIAPDAALQGYLDANLRLCGRGLGRACIARPPRYGSL
jgi:dipeptidyl aminopeptidase/acylaminoacyl peptidase